MSIIIMNLNDVRVFWRVVNTSADSPWRLDAYKMRYDSKHWFPSSVPLPAPVVGKSFLLMCETRGTVKPPPTIDWYLDGRPVSTGKHFYVIVSNASSFFFLIWRNDALQCVSCSVMSLRRSSTEKALWCSPKIFRSSLHAFVSFRTSGCRNLTFCCCAISKMPSVMWTQGAGQYTGLRMFSHCFTWIK